LRQLNFTINDDVGEKLDKLKRLKNLNTAEVIEFLINFAFERLEEAAK